MQACASCGSTNPPGFKLGIAGLLCERVRWLLGDGDAGDRLRSGAAAIAAPGLTAAS